MSAVSAAGLGAVIAATPVAFYDLQTIGALVLVWMAIKSWRAPAADPASVAAAHAGDCSGKTKRAQFLEAALLQVTNPMLIVYLLSLLPQFVHPEDDYVPRITLLIGLFVVLVWAVHVLYSYTAAFAGRRMKGKIFYMILNRTSAVLFWLLAAGVFWNIAGREQLHRGMFGHLRARNVQGKGHAALGVGRGNKAPVMALGDAADDRKPQAEPC